MYIVEAKHIEIEDARDMLTDALREAGHNENSAHGMAHGLVKLIIARHLNSVTLNNMGYEHKDKLTIRN